MSFDRIIYRLTDKRIPAATGIGLVGDILDHAGFQEQFCYVRSENKRSRKQIDCGAFMTSFIGLLCMGKPDFDAIAEFQKGFRLLQRFVKEWTRSEKHSVKRFWGSILIF